MSQVISAIKAQVPPRQLDTLIGDRTLCALHLRQWTDIGGDYMDLQRLIWMLDEIKEGLLHLEKARAYWEAEENDQATQLIYVLRSRLVGGDGIEPSTSCVSSKRSTAELTAPE